MACAASDDHAAAPSSGLYIKVQPKISLKMSKLKPGDVVDGTLSMDVYDSARKLFSSGSDVRLTVDHMEKRRRIPNDHWPGVVRLFTPRHENFPGFKTAAVSDRDGQHSIAVSLISASRMREVLVKKKKIPPGSPGSQENGAIETSTPNTKSPAMTTMVFEASSVDGFADPARIENIPPQRPDLAEAEPVPAGTRCKILLLEGASASKSKPGDAVRARLLEPVLLNSRVVLPAGSLFEGSVLKNTPPRWLSRAGSLYMSFNSLVLADGNRFQIAASLAGAELDQRSHTRMDAEGRLHGERPGKAWMAINLGVTAGIAKEADDTIQLIIEAIVSSATDVSTAGTGRIVAGCASGLYMITRHGRDVVLPRFTEMEISLDRPVQVHPINPMGTGTR